MTSATILLFYFFNLWQGLFPDQGQPPKREFRAVWVTTLNNMDWPSKKGLSAQEQQREFIDLLEKCQEANLNAVIVQVRPAADAFYKSNYEPWSEWLGGKQGVPPDSYYDPLQFMIEEAHKRNMELHAWLNPLRAVYHKRYSNVHEGHISNRKPEWILEHGNLKMLDPGLPEVRDYVASIVEDILLRYDVDGIHFDDYFYPYPDKNNNLNDQRTFRKHNNGIKKIGAWRRDNINKLVFQIHETILATRPRVKFGISPAGVWRNIQNSSLGSHTRGGYTSYDHLHADSRHWVKEGWVDYIVPQVYFSTRLQSVNYRTLIRWWEQNSFGRHLYIGHAAYKIYWDSDKSWYNKSELPEQLRYNRQFVNIKGSAYFRASSFMRNRGNFRDSLRHNFYKTRALIPPMPWKDDIPARKPDSVKIKQQADGTLVTWKIPKEALDGEMPARYVLYRVPKNSPVSAVEEPGNILEILPATEQSYFDNSPRHFQYDYLVTSLDRLHNESAPALPVKEPLLVDGKYTLEEIALFTSHFQQGVNNYFSKYRDKEKVN